MSWFLPFDRGVPGVVRRRSPRERRQNDGKARRHLHASPAWGIGVVESLAVDLVQLAVARHVRNEHHQRTDVLDRLFVMVQSGC
jgi:hypothetical protein